LGQLINPIVSRYLYIRCILPAFIIKSASLGSLSSPTGGTTIHSACALLAIQS